MKTAARLDRIIDQRLQWEQQREARRMDRWRRLQNRDQRFGIW